MKYLSLFSGIGSPEQALKNLGVDFELVGFSEIDKHAINSYCNVHNVDKSLNLGDITKINISSLPKDVDLITHGSPCFVGDTLVLTKMGFKKNKRGSRRRLCVRPQQRIQCSSKIYSPRQKRDLEYKSYVF